MDEGFEGAPRKKPWGKRIFFGCAGCLGAVALAIGSIVALNWTAIETKIGEAREELAVLHDVKAALEEELGCPVQLNVSRDLGSGRQSLHVSVEGLDVGSEGEQQRGLEIARLAARAHPDPERFDVVRVAFVESSGRVVRVQRSSSRSYEMDELLASDPDGDASDER